MSVAQFGRSSVLRQRIADKYGSVAIPDRIPTTKPCPKPNAENTIDVAAIRELFELLDQWDRMADSDESSYQH